MSTLKSTLSTLPLMSNVKIYINYFCSNCGDELSSDFLVYKGTVLDAINYLSKQCLNKRVCATKALGKHSMSITINL